MYGHRNYGKAIDKLSDFGGSMKYPNSQRSPIYCNILQSLRMGLLTEQVLLSISSQGGPKKNIQAWSDEMSMATNFMA